MRDTFPGQPLRGDEIDQMIEDAKQMAPVVRTMRRADHTGGYTPDQIADRLEEFAREFQKVKDALSL